MNEDRPFTAVAVQLTDAIGELEWAHPELADTSTGPAVAGTATDDGPAEGDVLAELLRIGVQLVAGLLRDLPEESNTTEVVALARVVTLLGDAYLHLTGQLL